VVGNTNDELGGSHLNLVTGQAGGRVPTVDVNVAPRLFRAVHAAITAGLVRACHDCSEGGLAVALAEMAFSGEVGADVDRLKGLPGDAESDTAKLFSESASRFVIEAKPEHAEALKTTFAGLPFAKIGTTVKEPRLRIAGGDGEWLIWSKLGSLKEAWQSPLRW
jgi:phosphoribosylformylglycinamidine synthase